LSINPQWANEGEHWIVLRRFLQAIWSDRYKRGGLGPGGTKRSELALDGHAGMLLKRLQTIPCQQTATHEFG
jgi:hypothetical protein